MEKINTITVNGVTYEIAGSGGGTAVDYNIPIAVDLLTEYSKDNLEVALGGESGSTTKIDELLAAVNEGKKIYVYDETAKSRFAVDVYVQGSAVTLEWCSVFNGTKKSSQKKIFIVKTEYMYTVRGKKIQEYNLTKIMNLTSSSSPQKVEQTVGDAGEFYNSLKDALDANGVIFRNANIYSKISTKIKYTDNDNYTVYFSSNLPGAFGTPGGGILTLTRTSGVWQTPNVLALSYV